MYHIMIFPNGDWRQFSGLDDLIVARISEATLQSLILEQIGTDEIPFSPDDEKWSGSAFVRKIFHIYPYNRPYSMK